MRSLLAAWAVPLMHDKKPVEPALDPASARWWTGRDRDEPEVKYPRVSNR
jgi:hypothetical protein